MVPDFVELQQSVCRGRLDEIVKNFPLRFQDSTNYVDFTFLFADNSEEVYIDLNADIYAELLICPM